MKAFIASEQWEERVLHMAEGRGIVTEGDQTSATAGDRSHADLQRARDFHAALLAMAGHDLRQPLQVIMNTYSWLARHRTQACELKYIERGELAIARLTEYLDHLIDAVRLQECAQTLALEPVRLGPLLANVVRGNADAARQKGLRLDLCPTSAVITSNMVLLEGLAHNLVRNALKYTPAGGRVVVGCRRRGPVVRIEVHDTGIGIPADHLSKVFEAFHRVDVTRPDGLGLGLFIVRRAADLLGHRIEVRSSLGHGTCFSVLAEASVIACVPDIWRNRGRGPVAYLPNFPAAAAHPLPMNRALVAAIS